jgi:hypothetical protein
MYVLFVSFLVLFLGLVVEFVGVDGYVVHVYGHPSLRHFASEDGIHHHLECGR